MKEMNCETGEVLQRKMRCSTLTEKYNALPASRQEERAALLKDILGSCGDQVLIKSPFYCTDGIHIHVGSSCVANFGCVFQDAEEIRIGDRCLIGPYTCIYTVNHDLDARRRAQKMIRALPVTIGDDVWIGGNCVILPGVTIGDRAVIGAGSIVTHDIPSGTLWAGNPARKLRDLE